MAADFNAGSIEGTVDLDIRPFLAGLNRAKAEADKFEKRKIKPELDLDTKAFTAAKDKAKVELDALGAKKAKPEVEVKGIKGALSSLLFFRHELKKTSRKEKEGGASTGFLATMMGGLTVATTSAGVAMTVLTSKVGLLVVGIAILAAALLPLTAALLAFAGAAAVAFVGVAASLALFAVSVKSAFGVLQKANKEGKTLTGWAGKAQAGLKSLTSGWHELQKAVQPQMMHFLAVAFNGIADVLPKIAPLLKTVASGMADVVKQVLAVTKTTQFSRFLKELQAFMGGFLKGLGPVLANLFKAFLGAFHALLPLMSGVGGWIEKMSKSAAKFFTGKGFAGWLSSVQKSLPQVNKFLGALWHALGGIFKGLQGASSSSLSLLTDALAGIAKWDWAGIGRTLGRVVDVIHNLAADVWPLLVKGFHIVQPLLADILKGFEWLGKHKTVAQVVAGLAAAFWLLNIAMDANPITLIVLGLAALAVGLAYAWKHSETFRKIVKGALHAVEAAFKATVGWIKHSFIPFFTKTIPHAFSSLIGWVKSHWPLILAIITGPIGLATLFIIRHWHDITGAFSSALHWIEGVFRGGWHKVQSWIVDPVVSAYHSVTNFLGKIKNGFKDTVSAVGHFFSGLPGKLEKPIKTALHWMSDHFISPINSLLGKVGLSLRLPTFADGGQVPDFVHGGGNHVYGGRYAGGGMLSGPWQGPKADNIIIRANPREFIEPVDAVEYYGADTFEAMRQKRIPKEALQNLPRFGLGGWIVDHAKGAASTFATGAKLLAHGATSIISAANPAHVFKVLADKLLHGFGMSMAGQIVGGSAKKIVDGLADKVKDFVGSLFSGGGSGTLPGGYSGSYGVGRWAGLASQVLSMLGQSQKWLPVLLHRMMVESGGNPRAINLWDSNAAAGHPSKGLMQTIDSTFNAYAGKYRGLGVWNPLANIYAAVRYALARYGVPAVGGTHGYAQGTLTARTGWSWVGEDGPELVRFRGGEQVRPSAQSAQGSSPTVERLLRELLDEFRANREALGNLGKMSDAQIRTLIQAARAA